MMSKKDGTAGTPIRASPAVRKFYLVGGPAGYAYRNSRTWIKLKKGVIRT